MLLQSNVVCMIDFCKSVASNHIARAEQLITAVEPPSIQDTLGQLFLLRGCPLLGSYCYG